MIFTNCDLLFLQEPVLQSPPPEERGHGRITLLTYYHYFRSGGNYLVLAAVFLVFLLGEVRLEVERGYERRNVWAGEVNSCRIYG